MGVDSMIVGVTAHSVDDARGQEFKKAGLDDCLEKPLTMAKLTSIIHKINNKNFTNVWVKLATAAFTCNTLRINDDFHQQ